MMFHHFHPAHIGGALLVLIVLVAFLAGAQPTQGEGAGAARFVTVAAVILLVFSLCGCATIERPDEATWQALHAVDTAQTLRASQSDCFREQESAWLIGAHPNEAKVAAWAVGEAGLHAFVTGWLLENDHPTLEKAWQVVTIGQTGYTVAHNISVGVRIGAPNVEPAGCHP
jgi:hypothetical protein